MRIRLLKREHLLQIFLAAAEVAYEESEQEDEDYADRQTDGKESAAEDELSFGVMPRKLCSLLLTYCKQMAHSFELESLDCCTT